MSAAKVLLVEDDKLLNRVLEIALDKEGYDVDPTRDGREGYEMGLSGKHDLIVLDLELPSMDGTEICRGLRAKGIVTPIVMLTAKYEVDDIVHGLDIGADDYIRKPFSYHELYARLRTQLRHSDNDSSILVTVGDLEIYPSRRAVKRSGQAIELMPKEFDLLEFMARTPGEAIAREAMLKHVWGIEAKYTSNRLDVNIKNLRAKIDKPFSGEALIKTVRGVGYKLEG